MPRFFIDGPVTDVALITGGDAAHIRRSLRMRVGEPLTLCDGKGTDFDGVIASMEEETVRVRVLGRAPSAAEPSVEVTLYQGLPKGDKLEWIIQKAVELGVAAVVPVVTARSVVRLEGKAERRRERWQRIADEAAGQCGRGILPQVAVPLTLDEALPELSAQDAIVLYEGGGRPLRELIAPECRRLSLLIGPEGGFDPAEIARLQAVGVRRATLGKRILRCETAPVAALAAAMLLTGNLE